LITGKVGFTGSDGNPALSVLALPELGVVDEGGPLSPLGGVSSLGSLAGGVSEVGLIPPPPMFSNDTSPVPSPTLPLRIAQLTSSLNLRFSQMQQQQQQQLQGAPKQRDSPTTGGSGPPGNIHGQQQQITSQLANGSTNGSGTECVIGKVVSLSGQGGMLAADCSAVLPPPPGGTSKDNDDPDDGGFSNYSSKHQGLQKQQNILLHQQQQQQQQQIQQLSHPQQVQQMQHMQLSQAGSSCQQTMLLQAQHQHQQQQQPQQHLQSQHDRLASFSSLQQQLQQQMQAQQQQLEQQQHQQLQQQQPQQAAISSFKPLQQHDEEADKEEAARGSPLPPLGTPTGGQPGSGGLQSMGTSSVPRKSALKKTTSALAVGTGLAGAGSSPKLSNGQGGGLPGSNPESPTVAQQPLVTAITLAQMRLRPTNSSNIGGAAVQNSNGPPFGKAPPSYSAAMQDKENKSGGIQGSTGVSGAVPLKPPPPYPAVLARFNSVASNADSDDEDDPVKWRDYYGDDEQGRLQAKIARKDSLALKLAQRPDKQELIERNILKDESYFRDRAATREALSGKLTRRLSLRPTAEELEQRNILYQKTPEERLKEKDMKKKV
ncbi:hypothetical protein BIW11_12611, partial [Tropilaelaps mercedesae]